jgi:hypothetical protein
LRHAGTGKQNPAAIIALAVYNQIMCAGFFTTVGLSVLFLLSGPILYPIARHFKKRRGETKRLRRGEE